MLQFSRKSSYLMRSEVETGAAIQSSDLKIPQTQTSLHPPPALGRMLTAQHTLTATSTARQSHCWHVNIVFMVVAKRFKDITLLHVSHQIRQDFGPIYLQTPLHIDLGHATTYLQAFYSLQRSSDADSTALKCRIATNTSAYIPSTGAATPAFDIKPLPHHLYGRLYMHNTNHARLHLPARTHLTGLFHGTSNPSIWITNHPQPRKPATPNFPSGEALGAFRASAIAPKGVIGGYLSGNVLDVHGGQLRQIDADGVEFMALSLVSAGP
ncbi:hypothetical protein P171DRAFT_488000 [Karstenula rhodostoma CBS 690.94]|uniref:Uncharacterized protein n=1 Tax=Karstenula rhodostoma CBS 690.94 TaxID=1392251 RepID=A0A9P4PCF7_9PLEO|nr:hypothetical protein P171DRAFT_488000 [Karstenula rhodostoma CBS 690.94]